MSWRPPPLGAAPRLPVDARRRAEVPVVLCVDVEPDLRAVDRDDPVRWLGFERFLQRLPALRERLSSVTDAPVALTWCLRMDPQVAETWGSAAWVVDTYGEALAGLAESSDELGLHTHTWRWHAVAGEWIADYADSVWAEHCVHSALDAFEAAFGRRCAVHRAGDRFLTGQMLSCLAARGVGVDLTVEPGMPPAGGQPGERSRGSSPDYRGVPTVPYHSSPASFPAPDRASPTGPVLVPLMSAPGRRSLRGQTLSPATDPFRFVIRLAAASLGQPPPLLALAVRSDLALRPAWDSFASNLEHLARRRNVFFTTATAGIEQLRGSVYARSA